MTRSLSTTRTVLLSAFYTLILVLGVIVPVAASYRPAAAVEPTAACELPAPSIEGPARENHGAEKRLSSLGS